MLLKNTLPALRTQVKYCAILNCTRFEWDVVNNFPKLSNQSWRRKLAFQFQYCMYCIWQLFLTTNGLRVIIQGKVGVVEGVMNRAYTIGMSEVFVFLLIGHFYTHDVLDLLKMMEIHENRVKIPDRGTPTYWRCRLGGWFLSQFTLASIGEAFLFLALSILAPCMPPLLGHLWQRDDGTCGLEEATNLKIMIGLALLQSYLFGWALAQTYLVVQIVFLIPMWGLYMYLKDVLAGMYRNPLNLLERYNHLKILETQLNLFGRWFPLPALFSMFTVLVIYFSYLTIKLSHLLMEEPSLMLLVVSYFNSAALYFLLSTSAGKINFLSETLLDEVDKQVKMGVGEEDKGRKLSVIARKVRSCMALRIRFSDNFADVQTPLVMMNFCVQQITTLLLTYR